MKAGERMQVGGGDEDDDGRGWEPWMRWGERAIIAKCSRDVRLHAPHVWRAMYETMGARADVAGWFVSVSHTLVPGVPCCSFNALCSPHLLSSHPCLPL